MLMISEKFQGDGDPGALFWVDSKKVPLLPRAFYIRHAPLCRFREPGPDPDL